MNTLKTLCMAVVLAAAGYGAYVTLTGRADGPPPPEVVDLVPSPPHVQGDLWATSPMATPGAAPAAGPTEPARRVLPITPPTSPVAPPATDSSFNVPPLTPVVTGTPAPTAHLSGIAGGATDPSMPPANFASTPPTASPASSDPRAEFLAGWSEAQKLLAQNRLADALLALSEWVTDSRLAPADRDRLLDLLDQLGGTVVYSREHLLEPPYQVQPGETLESIAARYEVPWQLLGKINGIADPLQVRPGDTMKVIRGPFDALVDVRDYQLMLFLHGRYAGRFRIGIGQDQALPDGEFTVQQKSINPPYFGPTETLAPNDPNNPLGGRLIDLGNRLGLHGTNDPSSLGRTSARGCIRLSPNDISDVYDILSQGSSISIRR